MNGDPPTTPPEKKDAFAYDKDYPVTVFDETEVNTDEWLRGLRAGWSARLDELYWEDEL